MKNNIRLISRIFVIVLALLCVSTFAVPETASALAKKPERVTVIKATGAYDSVTLTWKPSENARSYIIYRSGSKYGFYREIGTVTENTYTDKRLQTGKALWYKIRAVNDGRRSFKSPRISAVPSLEKPVLTAEAAGEGVYLSIDAVDGADGYVVFRDGKSLGVTGKLDFLDTDVSVGKKHVYKVNAYRSSGGKIVPSETSQEVSVARPSQSLRLVAENDIPEVLHEGDSFELNGRIKSNTTIEEVTVGIVDRGSNTWVKGAKYKNSNLNKMTFDLAEADEDIDQEDLTQGEYMYKIVVTLKNGTAKTLHDQSFDVIQPPGGQMIVDQAVRCAWPYGTPRSKFRYGSGIRTDAYTEALSVAYGSRSGWSAQCRAGASCDVFVGTVIRSSGYDKGFPRGLDEVEAYCRNHTDKWLNMGAATESQLQPGDVIFQRFNSGGGHITIYLGNNRVANAHYVSKTYGVIEKYSSKVKSPGSCRKSIVYRPIQ